MIIDEKKFVHITHNDGDAVGCALVAHFAFLGDDETIYWCDATEADNKTKELISEWEKSNVYPGKIIISDISVSLETWERLVSIKKDIYKTTGLETTLMMVDHHLTNPCRLYPNHVYVGTTLGNDRLVSAALLMLTHKFFTGKLNDVYNKKKIPTNFSEYLFSIVNDISRYDTWEWKTHPEIRDVPESLVSDMTKFIGPNETLDRLIDHLWSCGNGEIKSEKDFYPKSFIDIHIAIEIQKNLSMSDLESFVHITEEGEYVVASFIRKNDNTNDIADRINELYDVDIVRILYPDSLKVGFRTSHNDINLGRYAKRLYNGGGHPKASGAKLQVKPFIEIYEKVLNAPTLKEWIDR